MPLQSSGPISISDIKTELGSSDNSLRNLSGTAGFSTPDSMSEFYGYSFSSFSNDFALDYDGVNDTVQGSTNGNIPKQTFTVSMWVRVDATTKHNMSFYSYVGTLGTTTNDRLFIYYAASLNRLIVQFRKGNGQLYQRQYPLHNNIGVTGIANSTTGWVASQRGNTDSAGFTHLCFALNQTNGSATSGIKTYWNGNELTSSVNNANTFTTAMNCNFLAIGNNPGSSTPNAVMEGVIDEVYLYNAQLSGANASTIYGFGRNTENTFTTNYLTSWRMENTVADDQALTSLTNNGATFITTP
jgi:hypothetical protein